MEYSGGETSTLCRPEVSSSPCVWWPSVATARGVPGWSPIQVLTPLDGAWLRWSDGNRNVSAAWPIENTFFLFCIILILCALPLVRILRHVDSWNVEVKLEQKDFCIETAQKDKKIKRQGQGFVGKWNPRPAGSGFTLAVFAEKPLASGSLTNTSEEKTFKMRRGQLLH